MDTSRTTSKTVISYIIRVMVNQDLEQARKRMRLAWLVGFIISGVFFINAAIAIWGLAPETKERLPLGLYIFAMVEVAIVAFLSYGVLRQKKAAATALFLYFWISRIFWIAMGIITLPALLEIFTILSWIAILKFLVWQVLPAYIFFQGLRGAWTYFYLTHPQYSTGT